MECVSCLEVVFKEKHVECINGHSGGCQKCHMLLLKAKYSKNIKVYNSDSEKNTQCCFTCREPIPDINMGTHWKKNMDRLQPLMMLQSLNISKEKRNEIIISYMKSK
jgi:hypothetical protein